MEIKLDSLKLQNFKGIKDFQFSPDGHNCTIAGVNGVGKTTCLDGFLYLLFGKDSRGQADFSIKPLNPDGSEVHNLETSVEGFLKIDGDPLILKKVFKEKWTKKRGSTQADFTGHTTDYYISEVPIQKKEWDKRISEIINEELFKLLTSPTYFNALPWQTRREYLLKVCGNISDDDVIASDRDLLSLPDILNHKPIDDQKKIIAGRKAVINKRLTEIPARIDELNKSLADVSGYDVTAIQGHIDELDKEIQTMKDDTAMADLRKQRSNLQAKLAELTTANKAGFYEDIRLHRDAIEKLRTEKSELQGKAREFDSKISYINSTANQNEIRMKKLREEYATIADKKPDITDKCPTCLRSLPEDLVQDAIKKFNEDKSKKLLEINSEGKRLKTENNNSAQEKDVYVQRKAKVDEDIKAVQMQIDKAEHEVVPEPQDTLEIFTVKATIEAIEKEILERPAPDISSKEFARKYEQSKLAEIEASKKTRVRIDELKDEEKRLATEYEDLEKQTSLIEKFIVDKVNLLEDRINSKFVMARFKLFNALINGGIEETCQTLYNGIPYGDSLNSGHEILVGLDIVNTLQKHYGIKAPCWLDHRESLTSEPQMDCQLISLMADEGCPELEVSYE